MVRVVTLVRLVCQGGQTFHADRSGWLARSLWYSWLLRLFRILAGQDSDFSGRSGRSGRLVTMVTIVRHSWSGFSARPFWSGWLG